MSRIQRGVIVVCALREFKKQFSKRIFLFPVHGAFTFCFRFDFVPATKRIYKRQGVNVDRFSRKHMMRNTLSPTFQPIVTAATLSPASTSAPTGHPAAGVIGGAHSAGSERTVVSAALRPEKAHLLPGLMGVLGGSDFFLEAHAVIWDCARAIADLGQEVDAVKLLDYANSKQLFVGGAEYVVALLDDPLCQNTTDKTITEAATRVKEYSVTRLLDVTLKRGRELCSTAAEPPQSIIARVEDDLINLKTMGASSRRGPKKLVTILDAVLEHIQNVQDGQAPLALPTTFCAIDALIDGLYDEDLIVLAARPSMGKTSLLLGMAKGRAKAHNRPQLIFSCESRDLSLATRVLASEAHVASSDIRNARLDGEAMDRISGALHQIADLPIWIDDTPGLTIHEIRARARAFVAQHGKCDIWVDYLQKIAMSVDGKGRSSERNEHVGEVSSALKLLARELGVPVIALSQLSRNLESRANKRPMMSDLRESGQIEQDADVIMFIYRDEVYNADSKDPGVAEIIVAKQREGAIGTARVGWSAQSTAFYDLSV